MCSIINVQFLYKIVTVSCTSLPCVHKCQEVLFNQWLSLAPFFWPLNHNWLGPIIKSVSLNTTVIMFYKNSNIHFPSFFKNYTYIYFKKYITLILAKCKHCQILYLSHIWQTTDLIDNWLTFLPKNCTKQLFIDVGETKDHPV